MVHIYVVILTHHLAAIFFSDTFRPLDLWVIASLVSSSVLSEYFHHYEHKTVDIKMILVSKQVSTALYVKVKQSNLSNHP